MSYNETPTESPEPTPQPSKRRRWPWIVAIAVALFAGIGIGQAGGDTTEPTAAPEPEVVTETVTEEVEVEVEVVPQACLDALDAGEQGFDYSAMAMQAASDGFFAAADLDIAGMEQAQADLEEATSLMTPVADEWNATKASCREAAGE